MKTIFFLVLIFLNNSFLAGEEPLPKEIFVSEVKIEPVSGKKNLRGYAEIVLNGVLKIKDIQVLKIGAETKLKFPYYVSRQGGVFPQVIIHTEEANSAILKAVKSKLPQATGETPLEYEVTKMTPYQSTGKGKLRAFAAVTFNQTVTVECKIMEGKKGLWVSWPARPPKVKEEPWIKQVVILDKELKKNVEKDLFRAYHEKIE